MTESHVKGLEIKNKHAFECRVPGPPGSYGSAPGIYFKLHEYLFLLCPCILGQEDGAQELPFGNYFGLVKLGLTVFGV